MRLLRTVLLAASGNLLPMAAPQPVMASPPVRAIRLLSITVCVLPGVSTPTSAVSSMRLLRSCTLLLERKSTPKPTPRTARPSITMCSRPCKLTPVFNTLADTAEVGAADADAAELGIQA